MRKISSKYSEDRRRKRNGLIVGVILIFIMIFSVLGYALGGGGNKFKKVIYNGFEFLEENDFWVLEKDGAYFIFAYNPKEVERINSKVNGLNNYQEKVLYIFSESGGAELEIYKNLFYQNQIVQRFQRACFEGEECDENLRVKTCENNFIIIKESETSKIVQDDNCVFIEGKEDDLVKLSEEFLFKVLGITQ